MYKVVFGWLKKGGVPTGDELIALAALMAPILKQMKVRRIPANGIDERIIKLYAPVYEYWALRSTHPDTYWDGLVSSFAEVKALRRYRAEVKDLLNELYPPKTEKEKAAAKAEREAKAAKKAAAEEAAKAEIIAAAKAEAVAEMKAKAKK